MNVQLSAELFVDRWIVFEREGKLTVGLIKAVLGTGTHGIHTFRVPFDAEERTAPGKNRPAWRHRIAAFDLELDVCALSIHGDGKSELESNGITYTFLPSGSTPPFHPADAFPI